MEEFLRKIKKKFKVGEGMNKLGKSIKRKLLIGFIINIILFNNFVYANNKVIIEENKKFLKIEVEKENMLLGFKNILFEGDIIFANEEKCKYKNFSTEYDPETKQYKFFINVYMTDLQIDKLKDTKIILYLPQID